MKKKRYDQQGNCINCNAEYDEMSERLEFKGEPKYKKPIDLKLLGGLIIGGILILLLANFQSCN
jgi:hypothetical protein